ncbi:MAG TPA: hypothetical protein DCG53_04310 [Syntrophus sp. (in: bacteria)]|nr:hypothetical protein [Syntrophus sp. (in: bacteria)]
MVGPPSDLIVSWRLFLFNAFIHGKVERNGMKNIFLQIIATSCAIAVISGVKIMDLPTLPTFLLVLIVFLGYLFVLAGGISKKKYTKV